MIRPKIPTVIATPINTRRENTLRVSDFRCNSLGTSVLPSGAEVFDGAFCCANCGVAGVTNERFVSAVPFSGDLLATVNPDLQLGQVILLPAGSGGIGKDFLHVGQTTFGPALTGGPRLISAAGTFCTVANTALANAVQLAKRFVGS